MVVSLEGNVMFPVLAQQEIQAIEMQHRQFLAQLERGRLLRARTPDEGQTSRINELGRRDSRSWKHAIQGYAKWVGPRVTPKIGEEAGGSIF